MTPARGVLAITLGIGLIGVTTALFLGGGFLFGAVFEFHKSGRIGAALGAGIALILWRAYLRWCGMDLSSFRRNDRKD